MKRVAILFSGQGSQYVGMGKRIYDNYSIVKDCFTQASDILGTDMARLCFESDKHELNSTENTQPALLLTSVAAYQLLQSQTDIRPDYMAGHSLGELSALVCSGVLTFEDGLKLARARGLAMANCGNDQVTGMYAITKLNKEQVISVCNQSAEFGKKFIIANYNAPEQHILSGDIGTIAELTDNVKELGGALIKLNVSGAFHSPYMQQAADDFKQVLSDIQLSEMNVPVIANIKAAPYFDLNEIKDSLVQQIISPVRWSESVNYLLNHGMTAFIEAGPKDVLKKINQTIAPELSAYALDSEEDSEKLTQELADEIAAWKNKPDLIGKLMATAVSTRNKNWDETEYNNGVVASYQQMKEIYEQTTEQNKVPSDAQIQQAFELLVKIMDTKQVDKQEQYQRVHQVIRSAGFEQSVEQILPQLANAK
ncbi:ACP S-malonyltransferase [Aliikangiella maris]|uniref:ACP S-malonyltransferase n=2 Tax=Aliikangiella maris TaxID=3162458 RepID=A0ABV3MLJ2_9GAMM